MKDLLFIKNVKTLASMAQDKDMTYLYRILSLCHSVFTLNLKENRTKPSQACETVRHQQASIIIHPFNAMALDFFHFKGLITLFDLDETVKTEQAELLLQEMNDYLLIRDEKSEAFGIGSGNYLYKRNARDIINEGYLRMNECKGCFQIETLSYNALIMFMDMKDNDKEEDKKHFDMFLNKKPEEILAYLEDTDNNSFSDEMAFILFNAFVDSRMFEILCLFSTPRDEANLENNNFVIKLKDIDET